MRLIIIPHNDWVTFCLCFWISCLEVNMLPCELFAFFLISMAHADGKICNCCRGMGILFYEFSCPVCSFNVLFYACRVHGNQSVISIWKNLTLILLWFCRLYRRLQNHNRRRWPAGEFFKTSNSIVCMWSPNNTLTYLWALLILIQMTSSTLGMEIKKHPHFLN